MYLKCLKIRDFFYCRGGQPPDNNLDINTLDLVSNGSIKWFNSNLICLVILFTFCGVIIHESGHYLIAKILGYNPIFRYDSVLVLHDTKFIQAELPTATDEFRRTVKFDYFLIILFGPIANILLGSIGTLFLFVNKTKIRKGVISPFITIFGLISLYWLRQPIVLVINLFQVYFLGNLLPNSDEVFISVSLEYAPLAISFILGLLGLLFVLFSLTFFPIISRIYLIINVIIGGIIGLILWFKFVGPILLS
jgi:hypothetical protein